MEDSEVGFGKMAASVYKECLDRMLDVMIMDTKTQGEGERYLTVLVMSEYFAQHTKKVQCAKVLGELVGKYRLHLKGLEP